MKYINAGEILPAELLQEVQKYASGTLLYIPKGEEEAAWGEVSGYKKYLIKRNKMIQNHFRYGMQVEDISKLYCLSEETVKKIVYRKKSSEQLIFQPSVESAREYDENGLLEEWIHTYLLYARKNKPFSDGLYLEERYFIGPVKMPLCLLERNCGPEEHMKWHVDAGEFERRVYNWVTDIRTDKPLPPIIIGYAEGKFEINCNSQLFEALIRLKIECFPVVIWITERADYEDFRIKYSEYVDFE